MRVDSGQRKVTRRSHHQSDPFAILLHILPRQLCVVCCKLQVISITYEYCWLWGNKHTKTLTFSCSPNTISSTSTRGKQTIWKNDMLDTSCSNTSHFKLKWTMCNFIMKRRLRAAANRNNHNLSTSSTCLYFSTSGCTLKSVAKAPVRNLVRVRCEQKIPISH